MSWQLYRIGGELAELDRLLGTAAQPVASMVPAAPVPGLAPPPLTVTEPKPAPVLGDSGWVGKLLAVAGVAVTLVGVVWRNRTPAARVDSSKGNRP